MTRGGNSAAGAASAALKPGARAALDATVVATGKVTAFAVEAAGEGLVTTGLLFSVSRTPA